MPIVRWCASLIGACSLAISAAVIAPRAAGPYPIAWLTDGNSCELPCWRGIAPGVTSFDEAERLLRAMPGIDVSGLQRFTSLQNGIDWTWLTFDLDAPDAHLRGELGNREGGSIVQYILLYPTQGASIRLADLIARFGPPDTIQRDDRLLHLGYQPLRLATDIWSPNLASIWRCNLFRITVDVHLGDQWAGQPPDLWPRFIRSLHEGCHARR